MKDEVFRSMTDASDMEMNSTYARAVGRRTEFLLKNFRAINNDDHYQEVLNNGKKKLILRFLLSPNKLNLKEDGSNEVGSVEFQPQQLVGGVNEQRAIVDESKPMVTIDSSIVIKSIGYATLPLEGVPYNEKTKTIPHEFGCVIDENKKPMIGLYVCGWAKRGPNGIIDATLRDTKESFGLLKHHIETQ